MSCLKFLATFLSVVLLAICFSLSAAAQGQVICYSDDFGGNDARFGTGRYDYLTLVRQGLTVIRSMEIPKGLKVTLYDRDGFRGKAATFTGRVSQADIRKAGFGEIAQNVSMVIEPAYQVDPTQPFIILYADDFSGASHSLNVGSFNHWELGEVGNDRLSSIKIPAGLKVTLYEHGDFAGRTVTFTKNVRASDLLAARFNDLTSGIVVEVLPVTPVKEKLPQDTVRQDQVEKTRQEEAPTNPVVTDDPENPEVILFTGDFSGRQQRLKPGSYDLKQLLIGDNAVGSLRIPNGLAVKLFELPAFKGRSVLLNQHTSTAELENLKFNQLTSSLQIEEEPRVVLYDGAYAGERVALAPGTYQIGNLKVGDGVSSIKLKGGAWAMLFDNYALKGKALLLRADASTDFLNGKDFNNHTRSLLIGSADDTPPLVTVFTPNKGTQLGVLTPGEYPYLEAKLANFGVLEFPREIRVTLFEKAGFEGRSVSLVKGVTSEWLVAAGIPKTGSLRIELRRKEELVVQVFTDKFKGEFMELTPGKYRASDLSLPKRSISSMRIPVGMTLTLYNEDLFKGPSMTLDRDTDHFGTVMDNYAVSLIVEEPFNPVITGVPTTVTKVQEEVKPDVVVEREEVTQVVNKACTMTEFEFNQAYNVIKGKAFSDEKMTMALLATREKCLTNDQIRAIATLFSFEDQSLEFVQKSYENATQKDSYYTLESVFKFNSSRESFLKFLSEQ